LTEDERKELMGLAYKVGLRGVVENEVLGFANAKGFDVCMEELEAMRVEDETRKAKGQQPIGAVKRFQRRVRERTKQLAEAAREEEESKQRKQWKKSDMPTKEGIKEQLDTQFQTGEISYEEYRRGMVGLELVHEAAEAGRSFLDERTTSDRQVGQRLMK
jgi:hypothetical protein